MEEVTTMATIMEIKEMTESDLGRGQMVSGDGGGDGGGEVELEAPVGCGGSGVKNFMEYP